MITSLEEVKERNPDIISFSQVREVKIREMGTSRENKRTVDGNQISYQSPHMTYRNTFAVDIFLKDHPYIEHIYVPLCDAIEIKCQEPRKVSGVGELAVSWLLDCPEARIERREQVYYTGSFLEWMMRSEYQLPDYAYGITRHAAKKPVQDLYHAQAF